MVVVMIIGFLAAIAIPNFIAMQTRAKEGATKTNMHTFQLSAEDYSITNNGLYATDAAGVVSVLPGAGDSFKNPFSNTTGDGVAWEDRASPSAPPSATAGITSYADSSSGATYNIKGHGRANALTLVLSAGQ